MKRCTKCDLQKEETEFSRSKHSRDGFAWACKACARIRFAAYAVRNADALRRRSRDRWANNRERESARNRSYRQRNRATIKARVVRDQTENKERILEMGRRYRRENPEKVREKLRKYRAANMERYRKYQHDRRARVRNAPGTLTLADAQFLLVQQRGLCAMPWCRKDISSSYSIDHIVPLVAGGAHDRYNAQLVCLPCNQRKQAIDPITFMQRNGCLL